MYIEGGTTRDHLRQDLRAAAGDGGVRAGGWFYDNHEDFAGGVYITPGDGGRHFSATCHSNAADAAEDLVR